MKNKTQRLKTIIQIIENQKISNQEVLLDALTHKGYNLTQATLSRDLKFLKVGKQADAEKGSIYVMPNANEKQDTQAETEFNAQGYKSIEFSNNLCVIKTIPGYANAIASNIDSMSLYEVIGTIAGDDTILLIPREGILKQDLTIALNTKIPEIKNIINQ